MAIVEDQLVEVKWATRNKKWYIARGYEYKGIGHAFMVKVIDLQRLSNNKIKCKCDDDQCGSLFETTVRKYYERLDIGIGCYCGQCRYRQKADFKKEKLKSLNWDYEKVFNDLLKGEINKLPEGFVSYMDRTTAVKLLKLQIENLIKNSVIFEEDLPTNLTQELLEEYKMSTIINKFGLTSLLNDLYKSKLMPWEIGMVEDGYWDNDENVKNATYWFIDKLIERKIITSLDNLPKISYRKYLIEYNMSSLLKKFNTSFYKLMMFVYPGRFNRWDFIVTGDYYSNQNNIDEMLNWFINKIKEDGYIKSLDDIPNVVTNQLFGNYRLSYLLTKCFNSSSFEAMDYLFPNKWRRWEFNLVPANFWDNGNNLRDAVTWVVDKSVSEGLISNISDLNSIDVTSIFKKNKLSTLLNKYDINFILSLIYGDAYTHFSKINAISDVDGTSLDSYEEKLIHDSLTKRYSVVKPSKKCRDFMNIEFKEYYVPDWIIEDKVIVEYFGLYSPSSKESYIRKYNEKMKRKNEFFSSLVNYEYIAIYPSDVKSGLDEILSTIDEKVR
ncbi:hypothetical protein [Rossellomorea marisflavi]|uniref:hypothetical protein n=1 Tax=Rossellomorea marisflavi TaxID=189381 RepID=UPI00345D464F